MSRVSRVPRSTAQFNEDLCFVILRETSILIGEKVYNHLVDLWYAETDQSRKARLIRRLKHKNIEVDVEKENAICWHARVIKFIHANVR